MPKVKNAFFILYTLLVMLSLSCNIAFSSSSNTQGVVDQTEKKTVTTKEVCKSKNEIPNKPTQQAEKEGEKKKKSLLDESFTKDIF